MNHRRLADHAAALKVELRRSLCTPASYREMQDHVANKQNGWTTQRYEDFIRGTESMFNHMKCIAATNDAVRLLDHAAKSLPTDMQVFDMTPDVPAGFLYLGEPMMSGTEPILVYLWAAVPDTSTSPIGVTLIVMTVTPTGGFGLKNWAIRPNRTLTSMRHDMDGEDGDPDIEGALIDLRVVIAFNLLLAQEVVDTEELQPTRQMRRQASRHNVTLDPVVLVQLPVRHHTHSNGNGGTPIDWTHRWIVSGHWRKQWYATTETHRPKWIAPYVKGPDDKPLVVKEKLYVFDPQQGSAKSADNKKEEA